MATTMRIKLRSDLLDWEPTVVSKSSSLNVLNPYQPASAHRQQFGATSSTNSSSASYMEPLKSTNSNSMQPTAPGPNPRNLISQTSLASTNGSNGSAPSRPRLRRQPSILKPERRFRVPSSDLLDFDMSQIVTGTIRTVEKTETSLTFEPQRRTNEFASSHMDNMNNSTLNLSMDQSGVMDHSISHNWSKPQRRGSLLDWDMNDALNRSATPRASVDLLQSRENSRDRSEMNYPSNSNQFDSGILTYEQRTTKTSTAEVILDNNLSSQSGSKQERLATVPSAQSSVSSDNSSSTLRHAYSKQQPYSPLSSSGGGMIPENLSPSDTSMSQRQHGGSTSPLSPGTARSRKADTSSDWLTDLHKTMGLMEGRGSGIKKARNPLTSPQRRETTGRKEKEPEDNADLPSWQRVLLHKRRNQYEKQDKKPPTAPSLTTSDNNNRSYVQESSPYINRPNYSTMNLDDKESLIADQSFAVSDIDINQSTVERTPLRHGEPSEFSSGFERVRGLGSTIKAPLQPQTPASPPQFDDSVLSLTTGAYAMSMTGTPKEGSFTFSPTLAESKTDRQQYENQFGYSLPSGKKKQQNNDESFGESSTSRRERLEAWKAKSQSANKTPTSSRQEEKKWAHMTPSSPRARAVRSLQSHVRRRQVQRAVLGYAQDDDDEFTALATETHEMISKMSADDPTRNEAHLSLLALLEDGEEPSASEESILSLEANLVRSDQEPSVPFQSKVRRLATMYSSEEKAEQRLMRLGVATKHKSPRKGLVKFQAHVRRRLAVLALPDQVMEMSDVMLSPIRQQKVVMNQEEAATVLQCAYRKVVAERVVLDRLMEVLGDAQWGTESGKAGNGRRGKSQAVILEGQHWSALILARAASPLPMPGVDPELRSKLAEQYHRYIEDDGGREELGQEINSEDEDEARSSPVRSPRKEFREKKKLNASDDQVFKMSDEETTQRSVHPKSELADWQREALFARETLRVQELEHVLSAQKEAEDEALIMIKDSVIGLSPRQRRALDQLRDRLNKEEIEASEALKRVRKEMIAAGLRSEDYLMSPPLSQPSMKEKDNQEDAMAVTMGSMDASSIAVFQGEVPSTPSTSMSMVNNRTTTLDKLMDDDEEVDMDEVDEAPLEESISSSSTSRNNISSISEEEVKTFQKLAPVEMKKIVPLQERLKQGAQAAAKRIEERMKADREVRKLKKQQEQEEAKKKLMDEEAAHIAAQKQQQVGDDDLEQEGVKEASQASSHAEEAKRLVPQGAVAAFRSKLEASNVAEPTQVQPQVVVEVVQKHEEEDLQHMNQKLEEVAPKEEEEDQDIEDERGFNEFIHDNDDDLLERPNIDAEEYMDLVEEEGQIVNEEDYEQGEYVDEYGNEYVDDDEYDDEDDERGGDGSSYSGSITHMSNHSVASIVIPEDEEIDPPMSEYELDRQDEFTEKLDHQKDGHPLALGSFAKSLFDDDEQWYPCMVIGRERVPECEDNDLHFLYTVEFFDGDVKDNVPESDIAYITPEEARENMRDPNEEEVEGGEGIEYDDEGNAFEVVDDNGEGGLNNKDDQEYRDPVVVGEFIDDEEEIDDDEERAFENNSETQFDMTTSSMDNTYTNSMRQKTLASSIGFSLMSHQMMDEQEEHDYGSVGDASRQRGSRSHSTSHSGPDTPEISSKASSPTSSTTSSPMSSSENVMAKSSASSPLPPLAFGWIAIPSGATTYYFHEETGKVTYERPIEKEEEIVVANTDVNDIGDDIESDEVNLVQSGETDEVEAADNKKLIETVAPEKLTPEKSAQRIAAKLEKGDKKDLPKESRIEAKLAAREAMNQKQREEQLVAESKQPEQSSEQLVQNENKKHETQEEEDKQLQKEEEEEALAKEDELSIMERRLADDELRFSSGSREPSVEPSVEISALTEVSVVEEPTKEEAMIDLDAQEEGEGDFQPMSPTCSPLPDDDEEDDEEEDDVQENEKNEQRDENVRDSIQYDVVDETTANMLSAQAMIRLGQPTTQTSTTIITPTKSEEDDGKISKRHSTGSVPETNKQPATDSNNVMMSRHSFQEGNSTPIKQVNSPLNSSMNSSMDSTDPNDPVAQAMKAYRRLSSRSPAPHHGGLRKSLDSLLRNSENDSLNHSHTSSPIRGGDNSDAHSLDSNNSLNRRQTHPLQRIPYSPASQHNDSLSGGGGEEILDRDGVDMKRSSGTGLPEGWAKVVTDDGAPYYWNKNTNEVTWDKPEFHKAAKVAKLSESDVGGGGTTMNEAHEDDEEVSALIREGTPEPDDEDELPNMIPDELVDADGNIVEVEGDEVIEVGQELHEEDIVEEEEDDDDMAYIHQHPEDGYEGLYVEGDLSEGAYLSDDPQALSTVEEGDEYDESLSRVGDDDLLSSPNSRVTPDVFDESASEEEEEERNRGQIKEDIKPIHNVEDDDVVYEEENGEDEYGDDEGGRSSRGSESFGRSSEALELEQEEIDQMVDFLTHAGLEQYADTFMHFGFGSVDDLLNPDLVRDEDLSTFCGMSEEEVFIFRAAVNAVNDLSSGAGDEEEGEEYLEEEEEDEGMRALREMEASNIDGDFHDREDEDDEDEYYNYGEEDDEIEQVGGEEDFVDGNWTTERYVSEELEVEDDEDEEEDQEPHTTE